MLELDADRFTCTCERRRWRCADAPAHASSQHVAAERHDQAGLLGERDELERGDAAAVRMVPAHERLDGDGLAGGEVDDRLVLDDELALLDRALELGLEVVAADDRVAHRRRRRRAKRRLAGLLGLVHRHVGVADQLARRACARARLVAMPMLRLTLSSSLAGGDRQGERLPACARRARRRRARRRTGGGRGRRTRRRRGARRRRRVRDAAHEPRGDAAQQLVADGVAERVVDALEVVEVDEQHGDLARRARLERLAHLLAEQRAVGEPGERVVVGLVVELVLQVAQLGDGLLEAVVLERDAGVGGQRLEQRAGRRR